MIWRHALSRITLLGVLASLLTIGDTHAENWPQWRGPRNDGISAETGLPTTWSETENIVWKLPLPGQAGATPVVWGDRIFLTSARDAPPSESAEGTAPAPDPAAGELLLICVSTDGKQLWERVLGSGNTAVRKDEGNYASPSPVTDGKHVWAFMGTGALACFDFAGKEIWSTNLQDRYGAFKIQFGMASTPVLDGDRLYLQLLHSGGKLVLALDKNTGSEIWKHERASDATAECEQSYASPMLYRADGQEFLLTHGADYIVAHRLSDGSEIWRCGGMNPKGKYNSTLRLVASPVAVPGLIVVPTAKEGPVFGLRPDSKGDVTEVPEAHLWSREANTPDVPSPLVHDGLVYLCHQSGILYCLDAKTGEEYYKKRCFSDRYRASPVYADGKIYLTSRKGVVTVVKPGKEFEVLAENHLDDEMSASPAISGGRIYLRAFGNLYAIGAK